MQIMLTISRAIALGVVATTLLSTAMTPAHGATFCDLIRCSKEIAPVCGSNGVSYDNACMFQIAKCENDKLSIASTGKCATAVTATPRPSSVAPVPVPPPAPTPAPTPVPSTTAVPVAVCEIMCLDTYDPVCGSDGVTYQNKCLLQVADCNAGHTAGAAAITVASQGECPASDDTPTPAPSTNSSDVTIGPAPQPTADGDSDTPVTVAPAPEPTDAEPARLCEMLCSLDFKPVCGSDGKTYTNSCELRRSSCKSTVKITEVSEGECAAAEGSQAPEASVGDEPTAAPAGGATPAPSAKCSSICPSIYSPVCGTNGKTYSNKCAFEAAKCKEGISTMAIASEGACAQSTTPTPEPSAETSCKRACSREYKPVCGSDGVTYSNKCNYEVAKCTKRMMMTMTEGRCVASAATSG